MNQDQFTGILRAIVTAAGGYFIGTGRADAVTVANISGAVLVIGGAIWSFLHNRAA